MVRRRARRAHVDVGLAMRVGALTVLDVASWWALGHAPGAIFEPSARLGYAQALTAMVALLGVLAWKQANIRRGYLYVFRGLHPVTGRACWVYAGQSRRMAGEIRRDEHMMGTGEDAPKVWSDTVTSWRVVVRFPPIPKAVLDLAEILLIRTFSPLYNVDYNTGNPRRILPAVAARQRAERDAGIATPAYRDAVAALAARRLTQGARRG